MLSFALIVSAAAQGWCLKKSPLHACQNCTSETDCQKTPDGKTWFCQAAKDPECGNAPAIGFCKKDAPQNACKPCAGETSCGHTPDGKVFYCDQVEDPKCGVTPPTPTTSGFCTHAAPKNSCKACNAEEDCGHTIDNKVWYCQKEKEAKCGGPHPAPASAGWCAPWAPNRCGNCTTDLDCGNEKDACWLKKDAQCGGPQPTPPTPTTSGFCTHAAPKNSCKACNAEEDCGHTIDNKVWYCQKVKEEQCGGPHPTPASTGYCAPWAPNRCTNCTSDLDCGNEKNACWALKDAQCSQPTVQLV